LRVFYTHQSGFAADYGTSYNDILLD